MHRRPPKVACITCASGKRACSGTSPCDRCARLGKECVFPDELDRRTAITTKRRRFDVGTFDVASRMSIFAYGQPRPSKLALPAVLFPWQDIRLYNLSKADAAGGKGTVNGEGLEGVSVLAAAASAICSSGSDSASRDARAEYLQYLWDSTLEADVRRGGAAAPGDGSMGRSASGVKRRRPDAEDSENDSVEEEEEELYDDADDGEVDSAAPPRRSASSISAVNSGGGAMAMLAAAAVASSLPAAELARRERAEAARVLSDPSPSWLCVYDTQPPYALRRLLLNAPAAALFGWSQAETDLRVRRRHAIRWLHPDEVLVRSVVAVTARKRGADVSTFSGRYLSRRIAGQQTLPTAALLTVAAAARKARQEADAAARGDNGGAQLAAAGAALRVAAAGGGAAAAPGGSRGDTEQLIGGMRSRGDTDQLIGGAGRAVPPSQQYCNLMEPPPPMPAGPPRGFGVSRSCTASSAAGGGSGVGGSSGLRSLSMIGTGGADGSSSGGVGLQRSSSAIGPVATAFVASAEPDAGDEVGEALEALDDALLYSVFTATEHVQHAYDECSGATHTVATRFAVERAPPGYNAELRTLASAGAAAAASARSGPAAAATVASKLAVAQRAEAAAEAEAAAGGAAGGEEGSSSSSPLVEASDFDVVEGRVLLEDEPCVQRLLQSGRATLTDELQMLQQPGASLSFSQLASGSSQTFSAASLPLSQPPHPPPPRRAQLLQPPSLAPLLPPPSAASTSAAAGWAAAFAAPASCSITSQPPVLPNRRGGGGGAQPRGSASGGGGRSLTDILYAAGVVGGSAAAAAAVEPFVTQDDDSSAAAVAAAAAAGLVSPPSSEDEAAAGPGSRRSRDGRIISALSAGSGMGLEVGEEEEAAGPPRRSSSRNAAAARRS